MYIRTQRALAVGVSDGQTEIKIHYINKGNKWYLAKRWELWYPKRVKVFDIIGSPSALTVEQGKLLYNEIINILKDEEIVIVDFTISRRKAPLL